MLQRAAVDKFNRLGSERAPVHGRFSGRGIHMGWAPAGLNPASSVELVIFRFLPVTTLFT
jgi:hypothetical protein